MVTLMRKREREGIVGSKYRKQMSTTLNQNVNWVQVWILVFTTPAVSTFLMQQQQIYDSCWYYLHQNE